MTAKNLNKNAELNRLRKLFADEWDFRLRENPMFATYFGDHRFDDKLGSVSEADELRRFGEDKKFLERAKKIRRSALTGEDRLNYDIFLRMKEDDVESYRYRDYLMPVSKAGGFHSGFPEMRLRVPLKTADDYDNYIARLNAFKPLMEQYIELMRTGIKDGYIPPKVVLEGVEDSIKAQIVEQPEKSLFYKPFEEFPKTVKEASRKRLIEKGRNAVMLSIVPSYQAFLKFVMEEYIPAGRSDISASSLPNGKEYYRYRVRIFTTPELTAEKIHKIGLEEVKRIREEMEKIIRDTGFKGTVREFRNFMRTDARFYAKTPEALMKEAAFILKKMDGELPRMFGTLPRVSYGIRSVPEYIAPKSTTAYYFPPAGDGTSAGFYYINTYDLKSRPLYELEALSLHEAVPGHHLQIALMQELKNLPNFRRFGGYTAFVEGWALYSERLGLESGFYKDPYSNFGRLIYEMWRACRLVVDTGIHYFGWSREKAIEFMTEYTALTELNIRNEVDRYIAWPGQALAYKIGELKIRELRSLAEKKLGSKFDLRKFHDVVLLSGAIPLDVLEKKVNDWIIREKKSN